MKRRISGLIELALGGFLLATGAWIAYTASGSLEAIMPGFTRADLFTLIGLACAVTGIAAIVRGTSNLIRGGQKGR